MSIESEPTAHGFTVGQPTGRLRDPARPLTVRSPLLQLTFARAREFYRQPVAIFWVYGFPLLLALALSFAFRSRPVQRVAVDVAAGPDADAVAAALAADPRLSPAVRDADEARHRLRSAKTDLVVVSLSPGYEYHFDPSRPEGVLARAAAGDAMLRSGPARDAPPAYDRPGEEVGGR